MFQTVERTPEGKVLVRDLEAAEGSKPLERWPVDAREMCSMDRYELVVTGGQEPPAEAEQGSSESEPPVATPDPVPQVEASQPKEHSEGVPLNVSTEGEMVEPEEPPKPKKKKSSKKES